MAGMGGGQEESHAWVLLQKHPCPPASPQLPDMGRRARICCESIQYLSKDDSVQKKIANSRERNNKLKKRHRNYQAGDKGDN